MKLYLEYWLDNGWFIGKLQGVNGVVSQGKTLKELQENILDAYMMLLEIE